MKMLNRAEFLGLPATVHYHAKKSKEGYLNYSALSVKGDTSSVIGPHSRGDWWAQELGRLDDVVEANDSGEIYERIAQAESEGSSFSFPADFASHSRDGCFDADDRFVVLEVADMLKLTSVICESASAYTTQALAGLEVKE